jgi:hypothetical protein
MLAGEKIGTVISTRTMMSNRKEGGGGGDDR